MEGGAERSESRETESEEVFDDAGARVTMVMPGLASWAKSRLPELITQATTAIVETIPAYTDGVVVAHGELRRSVEYNLRFIVAALGVPEAPLDLAVPTDTGRRRARQGMPLPEVLRAYRLTFATLWNALVAKARRGGGAAASDAPVSAASRLWEISDQHAVALTEGYRAATAEMLVTEHRRRSALVEALLTGEPNPDAGPWEAATLLGLPPDRLLVVVAADTGRLAEESLPGIESLLAEEGMNSAWRLTPAQQLGIIAVEPGHDDVVVRLLRSVALDRVGLSPPYRSLTDSPRALHLAQSALASLPPGRPQVSRFDASPLAALMVCDPVEGTRLTLEVLGPVLGLPSDDRRTLLATLAAYLDHGGSAARTSASLHCHPNTVRYRLRRLQELTGRSLADPRGLAELTTASYALRLSPTTKPWRGRGLDGAGQDPAGPPPGKSRDLPASQRRSRRAP